MLRVKQLATETFSVGNGCTLLYTPIRTAPRLAMSFFMPGGNLLDPTPGVSDIVDRLLLKGTERRSQEQLAIDIDGLTLEVETDTKRDYSSIQATLLEEDLETSLELISDIFHNATLADYEREKHKLSGEIMMDLDSPKSRACDQFIRGIFQETAYGVVGSVILDHLPEISSLELLQSQYHRAFTPKNMIVSLGGNIAPERVATLLEKYFPAAERDRVVFEDSLESRLRTLSLTQDERLTFTREDSSQSHIYKGWFAPNVQHADYPALSLLNTILGGAGLSSRLFLELRDKQGLAYNVRSTYESYRLNGLFYLYIGTEPSNQEKCLKGFIEEVDKLLNTPVSKAELDDAKRNMLGRRSIYLETAHQQANYIGANYTLGRTPEEIERLPERIEAVTSEDIQRVAQTYLAGPALVSIVGPHRN